MVMIGIIVIYVVLKYGMINLLKKMINMINVVDSESNENIDNIQNNSHSFGLRSCKRRRIG